MNTILIVLLPILFFIGFQVGRSEEHKQMEEIRESVTKSWLQSCDYNAERNKK
jgi:lipopolysaccharide biosynthesis regulator YciM